MATVRGRVARLQLGCSHEQRWRWLFEDHEREVCARCRIFAHLLTHCLSGPHHHIVSLRKSEKSLGAATPWFGSYADTLTWQALHIQNAYVILRYASWYWRDGCLVSDFFPHEASFYHKHCLIVCDDDTASRVSFLSICFSNRWYWLMEEMKRTHTVTLCPQG